MKMRFNKIYRDVAGEGAPGGAFAEPAPIENENVDIDALDDFNKALDYDFTEHLGDADKDTPANTGDDATPGEPEGQTADGTSEAGQPAKVEETADGGKTPEELLAEEVAAAQQGDKPAPAEGNDAIKEVLLQAAKDINADKASAKSDDAPAEGNEVPEYNMQIPDEIMGAIRSEDPQEAAKGVNALANGLAVTIHKRVLSEFSQKMSTMQQGLPQAIQQVVALERHNKAVFDDFYGTYKQFNNPQLYPIVLAEAQKLSKETGAKGYSQAFKKVLASRLTKLLQSATAPAQSPAQAPAKQPEFNGGSNSRGAMAPAGNAEVADLMF